MFEASFISLLSADSALTSRLAIYKSAPAIFTDRAPQEVSCLTGLPYLVFNIDRDESDSLAIEQFDIEIDIYGTYPNTKKIKEIIERIYFICELSVITTDSRFSDIRLYRNSEGMIPEYDSKIAHYEIRLYARGVRKKWIDQL